MLVLHVLCGGLTGLFFMCAAPLPRGSGQTGCAGRIRNALNAERISRVTACGVRVAENSPVYVGMTVVDLLCLCGAWRVRVACLVLMVVSGAWCWREILVAYRVCGFWEE